MASLTDVGAARGTTLAPMPILDVLILSGRASVSMTMITTVSNVVLLFHVGVSGICGKIPEV